MAVRKRTLIRKANNLYDKYLKLDPESQAAKDLKVQIQELHDKMKGTHASKNDNIQR